MSKHKQRVALVTGANKGIGFEVARLLARKGFHVFIGARNAEAGRAAADQLRTEGEITFLEIDISKPASIRHAAEQLAGAVDHLDTLVNNAGIIVDNDDDVLKITAEIFET